MPDQGEGHAGRALLSEIGDKGDVLRQCVDGSPATLALAEPVAHGVDAEHPEAGRVGGEGEPVEQPRVLAVAVAEDDGGLRRVNRPVAVVDPAQRSVYVWHQLSPASVSGASE